MRGVHLKVVKLVAMPPERLDEDELDAVISDWNAAPPVAMSKKGAEWSRQARLKYCDDYGHTYADSDLGYICIRCCRYKDWNW